MSVYTDTFYKQNAASAQYGAAKVVQLVMEAASPKSVVDLGCATGVWLAAFRQAGVADFLGVDGDWVDRNLLQIPQERFVTHDFSKPFAAGRHFDMAVSLEVGEHLPEAYAAQFVETLVGLAPAVLFSAAIPGQGGLHHVNEQWPEYWAALFAKHGYKPVDFIRRKIWWDPSVDFWYKQNILFFVAPEFCQRHPFFEQQLQDTNAQRLSMVHPDMYKIQLERLRMHNPKNWGARQLVTALPSAIKNSILSKLPKF